MPELPEVETTCNGIRPHVENQTIQQIIVRQPKLRWQVPEAIQDAIGLRVNQVERKAKYIVLQTIKGHILIHLGMSGSLRIASASSPVEKHDHVDIILASGQILRLRDPRRFGAVLWTQESLDTYKLLAHLGIEPLLDEFDGDYLYERSRNKKQAIKQYIMDSKVVVGVGNIYANESLFMSGIDPRKASNAVGRERYQVLAKNIKRVLKQAIEQGGTTLRDFVREDGQMGYFQVELQVYGRTAQPCLVCETTLTQIKQGQRSTWFCKQCQK